MSAPHTDRADDLRDRQADTARRWWAALPPLLDRSGLFQPGAHCVYCDQPTPDEATRMRHDETCGARRYGDTY